MRGEEAVFAFVGRGHGGGEAHFQGLERDFLLEFAEGRFVHANAAQVEAENHVFGVAVLVELGGLKGVDVEGAGLRLHDFAGALVAGGEAVALVERFGNHDLVLAIHQIERGGFLRVMPTPSSRPGMPERCMSSL